MSRGCAGTNGSPPQVRGKLKRKSGLQTMHRITPAGAGKTSLWIRLICAMRDHPRRCGENSPSATQSAQQAGITPAGAGKTILRICGTTTARDHPRRCGENHNCLHSRDFRIGSPPQVRGKLSVYFGKLNFNGITPAGAGKTLKRSFRNQPFCS